jgi:cell wall-associated NlpC family hydrolase
VAAGPDAQTRMMERLLADPEFRARFRRAPAAVAREEGVPELAEELALAGDPMQTLDFRESRSSVAGVMMAAAVEGLGIYELGKGVFGHIEEAQAAPAGGAPAHSAASAGLDPDQFGQGGTGGQPSEEAMALLANKNVTFDASGIADLNAGRMDPRVVGVLETISEKHKVTVSTTTSDHAKLTAGGSVSNHYYGRAVDIATVDGLPVNAGNKVARQLALELGSLDPSIRPSEIGSPWALKGAAYFTDAAHQDHLHVGFDDPIAANWSPPPDVSSPAAVGMPAVPDSSANDAANGAGAGVAVNPDDASGDEEDDDGGEDGGDEEDEDEPDEDSAEHDNWDETHESGSDEDSSGSGDDGSSESGSDEDDGGSGDDGSDGDSGSDGGDSAPDAAAPDDGLQVPDVADGDYPGDNAQPQEIAGWMASAAQKRGLPPELPVMASLVESGMKNLDGGDADSAGFFQMRVGIWDKGDYSGYRDEPELQLKWFLDHAAAVQKQRVAGGQSVKDPKQYGEWIADVENPAAQYRGRYQLQLDEAQALLKKAGAKSGGGGAADLVDVQGQQHAGRRALAALAEAKKYMGTPYRWGGSTPKTGFDCSGLVQWAYAKAGIRIPRVTDQQILAANGTKISRRDLLPGDLVFFKDSSGYVHHVGISLGGDRFVNAPHTGAKVRINSLKESYYAQEFAGGRRFDKAVAAAGDGAQAASARSDSGGAEEQAAKLARAALDRDAAEVRRSDSALFKAIERQERDKANRVQFLKAVEPVQ